MIEMISNLLWIALGFISYLELQKIFDKEFGKNTEPVLVIPCILFSILGGITSILTIFFWLAWEWDGKFKLNKNNK